MQEIARERRAIKTEYGIYRSIHEAMGTSKKNMEKVLESTENRVAGVKRYLCIESNGKKVSAPITGG